MRQRADHIDLNPLGKWWTIGIAILACVVVLLVAFAVTYTVQSSHFDDRCTAAGGVPVRGSDGHVCINQTAVIRLS